MRPLLVVTLAAVVGCIVDLDPRRDCGDAYVDELAGEECEPSQAESLAGYCPAGEIPGPGACDPTTCRFVPDSCTRCGNGVLDPGEACDPKDTNQPSCLFGGVAQCRSDCTIDQSKCARGCGDGVVDVDLGEECDLGPVNDVTDKAAPVDCRELPGPTAGRPYGSGVSTDCVKCMWDRSNCRYCGNERLENLDVVADEQLHIDFDSKIKALPEVCDGDQADPKALSQYCQDRCDAGGFTVACAFTCADKCDEFLEPADDPAELACCTPSGSACPNDEKGELYKGRLPCCGVPASDPPVDRCSEDWTGNTLSLRVCP
ncbi:hypothetical protein [Nannocystis pusilla]|uniref:Lipoprotein n=1 Tax=Nannocystis pusilla TaxID=889268 RepID=A0ABS7TI53_9BACT|nr:hypothetical protein [Nannocystis pusilla]MBZ5707887.1 hypothetical protein [Nannocystis pusilla]